MKERHGIFIPQQHQLRRKFLIPFPELKQYGKVGSDWNHAGEICTGKGFLRDSSKRYTCFLQLLDMILKENGIFLRKGAIG